MVLGRLLKDMALVKRFDLLSTLEDIFIYRLHAEIVVWDSHPLTLCVTPQQAHIDGIGRLSNPYPLNSCFPRPSEAPNWDREKNDTVYWNGVPPLRGWNISGRGRGLRLECEKSCWLEWTERGR